MNNPINDVMVTSNDEWQDLIESFRNYLGEDGNTTSDAELYEALEQAKSDLHTESYSYCSTQFDLPDSLGEKIKALADEIPKEYLAEEINEDWHITCKFGLHDPNPNVVKLLIGHPGGATAVLGATSLFLAKTPYGRCPICAGPGEARERGMYPTQKDTCVNGHSYPSHKSLEEDCSGGKPSDADVLKIDVSGDDLHILHNLLKANAANTETHETYMAHITICYLRPGCGLEFVNDQRFLGTRVTFDTLTFCGQDGTKTPIYLTDAKEQACFQPVKIDMAIDQTAREAELNSLQVSALTGAAAFYDKLQLELARRLAAKKE